jgi:16S rRNA (adenine1518-N6/adenine1519-N6)-dimethyltransferase
VTRRKRRRLGQHFLVDRRIADRIVELLGDEPPRVLEIGPGRGALTLPLLERFDRVLALELDAELAERLTSRVRGAGLELRTADALHEDLHSLLASEAPWQVAANLPYSVGSAILRRLLPRHELLGRIVVMLQREVVERIVARPGDRAHGLLALERAAFADARVALRVSPHAFRPRPRVSSSVVVLDPHPCPHPMTLVRHALDLASRALTHPRKTLRNALGVAAGTLQAAGLDPSIRPGHLSLDDWVRLAGSTPGPQGVC